MLQPLASVTALSVATLTGCVSVTAPVLAGNDTYMIGLGARGGFFSDAELMAQTTRSAGEFCTKQGLVPPQFALTPQDNQTGGGQAEGCGVGLGATRTVEQDANDLV